MTKLVLEEYNTELELTKRVKELALEGITPITGFDITNKVYTLEYKVVS